MNIIPKDLETEDGEIIFKNGDLSIFDSSKEHISALVDAFKGEWKQYPMIGIETELYLNSNQSSRLQLQQEFNKELFNDGYNVDDLLIKYDIASKKLLIKTNATRYK